MKEDLALISRYQRELGVMGQIGALLDWDQQTEMPKEAFQARAEQSAFLSEIFHKKTTSNEFYSALKRLQKAKLETNDSLVVKKLYKSISKSRKLSTEFVSEMAKAHSLGHSLWEKARKAKDFEVFRPQLDKIFSLHKKKAEIIGYKGHPYNALLDDFEEGMTVEKLKPALARLKIDLRQLLDKIESTKQYEKQKIVLTKKNFPAEYQEEIVKDFSNRIGLTFDKTVIAHSEHPFTTKVGFNDVRFTIAVRKDPLFALGSGFHEAGHALYESNLPEKHKFDVLGDAPSLGIHESQSRFWENNIGASKDFWRFYFPKINNKLKLGSFDQWYKEVNFVTPGPIRIESDEVHYCLHVILRFELELALLEGSIKVKDLKNLWNEKSEELLGVKIKNDVEGVLQDVHWSGGAIGYFPTYALGSIYASQIHEKMKSVYSKMGEDLSKGNFTKISSWLKENIHSHGSKMLADDIIKKATGSGLNPEVYVNYLTHKYKDIYGF